MRKKRVREDRTPGPLPTGRGAALWALYQRLAQPLWLDLLRCRLMPRRRMAIGGTLFPRDSEFVSAVAAGLSATPELFAHLPVQGRALQADQDDALFLLFLSHGLTELGQLAYDAYLQKQGTALQAAKDVMEEQQAEANMSFLSEEQRVSRAGRASQLAPAQRVLSERQRRRHATWRRSKLAERGPKRAL